MICDRQTNGSQYEHVNLDIYDTQTINSNPTKNEPLVAKVTFLKMFFLKSFFAIMLAVTSLSICVKAETHKVTFINKCVRFLFDPQPFR